MPARACILSTALHYDVIGPYIVTQRVLLATPASSWCYGFDGTPTTLSKADLTAFNNVLRTNHYDPHTESRRSGFVPPSPICGVPRRTCLPLAYNASICSAAIVKAARRPHRPDAPPTTTTFTRNGTGLQPYGTPRRRLSSLLRVDGTPVTQLVTLSRLKLQAFANSILQKRRANARASFAVNFESERTVITFCKHGCRFRSRASRLVALATPWTTESLV
jgi:hypothetical protein